MLFRSRYSFNSFSNLTDRERKIYRTGFRTGYKLARQFFKNNIRVALTPEDVGHIIMGLKLYSCNKKFKADIYDDLAIYCKMTKNLRHKKKI